MNSHIETFITHSIQYASVKWKLCSIKPFIQSFTNNYVAVAESQLLNKKVVLKICIHDTHEREALHYFNGNGCVELLDYDVDHRALLLAYIQPGTMLKELFPNHDSQAVAITAAVIKKLQRPSLSDISMQQFKTITQWLQVLDTFTSQKFSQYHIQKARQFSEALLNTIASDTHNWRVLHGDLHHENILQNDQSDGISQSWIAIDPKGVIGPLEYEIGRFIINPIPELLEQSNVQDIINNRISTFCTIFGFENQRITDWVFVQAMISACWAEHDASNSWSYFVRCAQIIDQL